jgi:DNA-binding XRE family transcriptional regulator
MKETKMEIKKSNKLPKILKINRVEEKKLLIYVLFNDGEDRILDFKKIFNDWKIKPKDPEYKLLDPKEFKKVKLNTQTLYWDNIEYLIEISGKEVRVPFEIGPDTLYDLSQPDQDLNIYIGTLLRTARKEANLTQLKLAQLSGTSRTYITRLESNGVDIEIKTLKKIVEAGLNKQLAIKII